MKGLILIFVLLSGISSAIAQEKLWLDKNYQWTDDSIQAVICSCFQDKQEMHQGGRVCFGRTKEGCLAFLRIQKQSPQKDKGRPAYIILCKWQGQPDRSI